MSLMGFLLTQTVTILPFIRDGCGEPIYGNPEVRKCRLEYGKIQHGVSLGASGYVEEQRAGARMFCLGEKIPIRSIVTYKNQDYIVTQCRILNGFADDHLEVTLE